MHALALEKVEVQVQDEEFGFAREAVGRQGCFAAVGDSFALHQAFVRETIARYRELVEAVERRLLRWSGDADQGLQLGGGAIALELSEPLHDLDGFLQSLFSCREPFRLWGIPDEVADGVWQAEAVDLHVGQPLRIQLSDRWLRLMLGEGSCGNTVARLVANLQHGVDSCVRFVDPELQALLEAGAAEHRVPSTDPPSP
jgi:hypothetical protein